MAKDRRKRVALYARVSTTSQSTHAQLDELRVVAERASWEVVEEYTDEGISGARGRERRPALDQMLKDATRRKFDLVACWSLDRLGRSTKHLADTCEELRELGVGLFFCKQALDTTTASGRLFFTVLSGVAEFERELIAERVRSGLDRARRRGKRLGRPPAVTPRRAEAIRADRAAGMSLRQVARKHDTSTATVRRVVAVAEGGGS
jgi:DNA invertase Pin-like site-specific DNA recombinase